MSEYRNRVFIGSALKMDAIPDGVVHTCVTSPPYFGLRSYDAGEGEIGCEKTLAEYVENLVAVFREVRRCLRDDGTAWLNLGDSYASAWSCNRGGQPGINAPPPVLSQRMNKRAGSGLKEKDLIGVPWRVALALQADGWWLRDCIVWAKPVPMPSSVRDRCTPSYEFVFMLAKRAQYFANMDAVRQPLAESSKARLSQAIERQAGSEAYGKTNGPMKAVRFGGSKGTESEGSAKRTYSGNAWEPTTDGANLRNVWTIHTAGFKGAHYAVMPQELARRCILIGSPPGGLVLDPFMGSGTTARVAIGCGRDFVGYELNQKYVEEIQRDRLGLFGGAA